MRIYHKMFFPVKIILKGTENYVDACRVSLFDGKCNELSFQSTCKGNIQIITTEISLPNKLIIGIKINRSCCTVELDRFSLAGIDVEKSILASLLEYKYSSNDCTIESIEQLNDLESYNTLDWDRNGYGVVNIFHPNPFAWQMFIGNKIKIK